jgi:hypothetical protein
VGSGAFDTVECFHAVLPGVSIRLASQTVNDVVFMFWRFNPDFRIFNELYVVDVFVVSLRFEIDEESGSGSLV